MDEFDKCIDIALNGTEAREAVDVLCRQVSDWGLAIPPVEPLVLDFGLGRFHEVGEVECWIANEAEEGYCGKFLFVVDGQTCPMHHHRRKHETFYVVKGRVRMQFEGREIDMAEGDVLPVPPGKRHAFTGIGPALLLEVSTPCLIDDNYFDNPDIPIGKAAGGKGVCRRGQAQGKP